MLRNGDVVQINSNHDLYGGLMFVVERSLGEEMTGTFPGMAGGAVTLKQSLVSRKLGRVEQKSEDFYGISVPSTSVSLRQRV